RDLRMPVIDGGEVVRQIPRIRSRMGSLGPTQRRIASALWTMPPVLSSPEPDDACAARAHPGGSRGRIRTAGMDASTPTTRQKALALNVDGRAYGTFAEIGGGQEVAGWFFAAGSAAGTVAKAISAYDMAISDGVYGAAERYVSRRRLEAMLDVEFSQLVEQLGGKRGDSKCFFAFANTVATRRFQTAENGRGWLGVRFQAQPREQPPEVIIHAHLLDRTAEHEREALGILGVNLIHAAFYGHAPPERLIGSLMDDLSRERIEIDMIKLSGPVFADVDN